MRRSGKRNLMRPTLDELLAGAQQSIEEVVLPDLQSSFARSRARMVVRILEYVRRTLAGEAAFVAAERQAVRELLTDLQAVFAEAAGRSPELDLARVQAARLGEALAADLSDSDPATGPGGEAERLTRLTSALDGAIGALDEIERLHPDPAIKAARARVRRYLREALERELALTGTRRQNVAP
ncbi:MAG TPA: hypothetical protein VHL09_17260 [Dehalococcoidia bacterium]|nr:hypothetical protein [Dehalococcoidia bacterium]